MHRRASDLSPSAHELRARLEKIVGASRVLDRPAERIAHAHDASFYRLIPQAVVFPKTEAEVLALFALSAELTLPLTFRAAGTSLSGQAVSDGLLVDLSRSFGAIQVEEGGAAVRVQPGAIGGHVNLALLPHGTKIGPDPASIHTCRMGGILSNNASGMCCGVEQNAYHTLRSLRFLLPSGTCIDTASAQADDELRSREPALHQGLLDLKREIEADAELPQRIRAKYRMKNTTGYSLNAFLDYARPVDIFAHLLIGGEGWRPGPASPPITITRSIPARAARSAAITRSWSGARPCVPDARRAGATRILLSARSSPTGISSSAITSRPATMSVSGPIEALGSPPRARCAAAPPAAKARWPSPAAQLPCPARQSGTASQSLSQAAQAHLGLEVLDLAAAAAQERLVERDPL